MSRSGPRPHCWKVQGAIPHAQYLAFLQMRAQANYRGEEFNLSFEDYQTLWQGKWERKGRGTEDFCLTRDDPEGAWVIDNVICLPRVEQLYKQAKYRMEKRNGNKNR